MVPIKEFYTMDHLKTARRELALFTKSPARENLEIARVNALIAIGESLDKIAVCIWEDLDNGSSKEVEP